MSRGYITTTDLISYLFKDKVAEFDQERNVWCQTVQQAVMRATTAAEVERLLDEAINAGGE